MRVAVVGTGSIGRRHIGNLLALGVRDVVAVSEYGRRDRLEVGGSGVAVVQRFDSVLDDPDVAAVVIGNPTVFHLDYTRRAIFAGKNVYLEKPASISAHGVAELSDVARRRGLVVAIGTQLRFNDMLVRLRERLEAGEAGLILSVEAHLGEHIADYHPGEDYRLSYTARSDLGGGVLLTQIHQIDYLNWMFGPFRSAFAVGGRRSDLELDVEDCVSYLLRGRDGIAVHGHLNYLERPKRIDLHVAGTKGSFVWHYFTNTLAFTPARLDAQAIVETRPFDRNSMFLAAMSNFLEAVRGGERPRASLEDGHAALCIVDAIKLSCETGAVAQVAA